MRLGQPLGFRLSVRRSRRGPLVQPAAPKTAKQDASSTDAAVSASSNVPASPLFDATVDCTAAGPLKAVADQDPSADSPSSSAVANRQQGSALTMHKVPDADTPQSSVVQLLTANTGLQLISAGVEET